MSKVILNKSNSFSLEDISKTVEMGLNGLYPGNFNFNKIIIKPNLCYYWDYTTGQTTDPRVVGSIIDWIRNKNSNANITIAETDASAMKTRHSFKMLGYEKLASEKQVQLENLSKGDIVEKKTTVLGKEIKLPVNELLDKSDLLINVPTLKTHREIGFTCAMKNIFGLVSKPRKFSYHKNLAETIVAINKIIKSNLIVVDGIIAAGKYPKKMGVIITGEDAYSTDVVVSDLVGYSASKVSYLKIAGNDDFFNKDKANVIENTAKIDQIKKDFPKPNYRLDELLWKSELFALKLYAKIVGDVIPPVLDD